ncbi:MAG TPA: Mur ligase family protein [Candidatus Saccharimonadales bacterium]|jgi:UDP-N-acetylmuramoyl-tripeptide--D-alanyl-D-alanine ligase|nr:Mur ligase family protein [Candidatus Saccharimonadales bacterium]
MLQRCEYEIKPFLNWYFKVEDFNKISIRGSLVKTSKSKLLLLFFEALILIDILAGIYLLIRGFELSNLLYLFIGLIILILTPLICAMLLLVPLVLARVLVVKPRQMILIKKSADIFKNTKAIKIAVAGSFGKTTMKELLATVLSEAGEIAATPGNKNVAASHAVFAAQLTGREKFVIVEFGEGKPGDVVNFTKTISPNIGVVTGIAPAHLDKYPSVDAAADDIFSLTKKLEPKNTYVNGESDYIKKYITSKDQVYDRSGVGEWKVSNVSNGFSGISFDLSNASKKISVKSQLLGRHQIGPLSAVAVLAYSNGLSIKQIEAGLTKTKAYEHRMELKNVGGAYVIDDAYNGNLEGIKAGLNLLVELHAKRKIYVTPGLVDQGNETKKIHNQIGKLILKANPTKVVLIKNSVTDDILAGLSGFKGELVIEENPLQFYLNLDKFLASGDLLMMQNDWPDNYK